MNINGISKSITPMYQGAGIKRRLFEMIPNILVKDSPLLGEFGNFINRPDVNRGIMGLTAIVTQPFIDKHNPDVDKETAETSMCRTTGKIIAGTTVGCVVRAGVYYLINACTSLDPNAPKWKKWLMPSEQMQRKLLSHNNDWFKSYKNVLATALGLGIMLITNPLLDVPLTSFITKKLNNWRKSKQANAVEPEPNPVANPTTNRGVPPKSPFILDGGLNPAGNTGINGRKVT